MSLSRATPRPDNLTEKITQEQASRKELEAKVMKMMGERCLALHVELSKEKKLREETEERSAKDV